MNNNTARWYGEPPYSNLNYDVTFDQNGTIKCSGPRTFPICIHNQCFCKNIDHALANLTSNLLIKLTIDVRLSSVALLHNLHNISIIGQINPTITCNDNGGGLHFISCHNCTIDGITWYGCGTKFNSSPVLKIENSSGIVIQNCTFKHSIRQAIVFSNMSGNVNINHCNFVNNTNYNSHGTAIQYLSNCTDTQIAIINNCNFVNNSGALSIIFIGKLEIPLHGIFILNNSYFYDNQGTSIYLFNQNLYITGKCLFSNNTAENGAGILPLIIPILYLATNQLQYSIITPL